ALTLVRGHSYTGRRSRLLPHPSLGIADKSLCFCRGLLCALSAASSASHTEAPRGKPRSREYTGTLALPSSEVLKEDRSCFLLCSFGGTLCSRRR
ncbi:MAG: hypothetical protein ACK559_41520, partial [bacterium]